MVLLTLRYGFECGCARCEHSPYYAGEAVDVLLGAMLPYVFSAMAMGAVGRAAADMIKEVGRQFNEIKGLREGTAAIVREVNTAGSASSTSCTPSAPTSGKAAAGAAAGAAADLTHRAPPRFAPV